MNVSNAEHTVSYVHHAHGDLVGAIQSVVAPSGLDFEAASGSIIHYYLSKHLLRGH